MRCWRMVLEIIDTRLQAVCRQLCGPAQIQLESGRRWEHSSL